MTRICVTQENPDNSHGSTKLWIKVCKSLRILSELNFFVTSLHYFRYKLDTTKVSNIELALNVRCKFICTVFFGKNCSCQISKILAWVEIIFCSCQFMISFETVLKIGWFLSQCVLKIEVICQQKNVFAEFSSENAHKICIEVT